MFFTHDLPACLSHIRVQQTYSLYTLAWVHALSPYLSLFLSLSLKHFFLKCKPPHEDRRECLSSHVSEREKESACEYLTCPFVLFVVGINIRHLGRNRHIISYSRGTRMCLLNNYAQFKFLFCCFLKQDPDYFQVVWFCCREKLLSVYVGSGDIQVWKNLAIMQTNEYQHRRVCLLLLNTRL